MGKDANKPVIAVLGGGFAGALTTRALLKEGCHVILIDENARILGKKSSSQNECFKLHTGMHYIGDLKTAEQCLKDSIDFARAFPDCILGKGQYNLPWRRGRHYLVSKSLFDLQKAREVAERLKTVYREKIKEDAANQVFGPPDSFIVELENPAAYADVATEIPYDQDGTTTTMNVVRAFETGESQIDIDALRDKLEGEFEPYISNSQLGTYFSRTVTSIKANEESLGYVIYTQDSTAKKEKIFKVDAVVNCTWQNIETLDGSLMLNIGPTDETLIRLKVSIVVQLPESLKNFNTCIFSSGPFCSITNIGNGTAVLTYEPVTNVGYFKVGEEPNAYLKSIMATELTPTDNGQGQEFATKILSACADYLKPAQKQALLSAKVTEVRLGYVRMTKRPEEEYALNDAKSPIHRRQGYGIEPAGFNYFRFGSMKMTYAEKSAVAVISMLKQHFIIKDHMAPLLNDTLPIDDQKFEVEKMRIFLGRIVSILSIKNIPVTSDILSAIARSWKTFKIDLTKSPNISALQLDFATNERGSQSSDISVAETNCQSDNNSPSLAPPKHKKPTSLPSNKKCTIV